jgi:hypothetical protein
MPGISSTNSYPIERICAAILKANAHDCQADCSGYLKQVAARLGVILPNLLANGIVDYLNSAADWTRLENDAKRASELASQGYFVVAGLKDPSSIGKNGHVVVVVPGWSVQGFPMGYWGSLRGAQFAGWNASLSEAWKRPDLALVSYFAIGVAALAA